jgi:hypothetical protein
MYPYCGCTCSKSILEWDDCCSYDHPQYDITCGGGPSCCMFYPVFCDVCTITVHCYAYVPVYCSRPMCRGVSFCLPGCCLTVPNNPTAPHNPTAPPTQTIA